MFPARAHRPVGWPLHFDPSWWAVLQPMVTLGLIWEPKEYKAKQGKYDRVMMEDDVRMIIWAMLMRG